jgi:hypothetical protein
MVNEEAILRSGAASVVAPAGCGKTELIARTVQAPDGAGALILTHTHAGVNAIRGRLSRAGVDRRRARVETIAGWCLRYSSAYPSISGVPCAEPTKQQWDSVYDGALNLLKTRAIGRVVQASYSRLLVDEYQDCTARQHAVVQALAHQLPTCVLGDPLQGIFGFAGGSLSWRDDVERSFPALGALTEPWRWRNKNDALGRWLLDIREPLQRGEYVDLSSGPIKWSESSPENQRQVAFRLAKEQGSAVAIRKWGPDAHHFARNLGGLYPSMEEVDCNALLEFAADLDRLVGTSRAARLVQFAGDCFTKVDTLLESPRDELEQGRIPNPSRYKSMRPVVAALAEVARGSGVSEIVDAMRKIAGIGTAKLFRRELWHEAVRTMSAYERGSFSSIRQSAWTLRNRHRAMGRAVESRLVSRTLLIKGLEFDHAFIVDADEFEDPKKPGDGAKNFYVAATRGARSLLVLSSDRRIRFSAPRL